MRIRGVIFDMDGTLTVPNLDFAKIRAAAGLTAEADIIAALQSARVRAVLARYERAAARQARLNRGTRTLLRYLARERLPVGLVTRNSRASVELVCRRLGLRFEAALTREEPPHKPAPEPVWTMARQWRVPAKNLLVVGDYKWDLLCAHNAGARGAVLLNGAAVPEWAADAEFIVRRLTELVAIIAEENK